MTRREVPSKSWCAKGDTQARCHAEHSYGMLPAGPGGGRNRACPVCGENLSVNPGDKGMDARKFYACQKLIASEIANGSLLKMCLQAISEGDGDVSSDPARLLPADRAEFIALGRRAGLERIHCHKLADRWLPKLRAGVTP